MKACASALPASYGLPLWDLSSNRHGGNAESEAAYERAAESGAVTRDRERVLKAIEAAGAEGLTCKELAAAWDVGMNAISGRFTELSTMHWIRRKTDADGRTVRRDGCAVWIPTARNFPRHAAGATRGEERRCTTRPTWNTPH